MTLLKMEHKDEEGNTYIVLNRKLIYAIIISNILLAILIILGFLYLRHLISIRCAW